MSEAMNESETIGVEVAYALPDKQAILALEVSPGTTVMEAAAQSGITDKFEGIDLENAKFGIFVHWSLSSVPAYAPVSDKHIWEIAAGKIQNQLKLNLHRLNNSLLHFYDRRFQKAPSKYLKD